MSKRTGTKVQKNRTDDEFIMLPTVDFCFKELMRNEKVRKGIIAALLGVRPEEIKETRLLPTILRKEYEDDKYGILDVRVEMHNGTQIDFEMQVAEFDFWKKRIVFYLSKMVTDQIHKGDDYDKIQKCIHVSILDFVHFPEANRYYRKITFCDTKTGEIYKMQNGNPSEGSFISDTLDLKLLSKLGSLKAMTTIPEGSDISFEVRTGNVARVDNTWSDFTKVSEDGKINAPDGRFLQFRITMKNSNANEKSVPILSSMDFTYIENNLPPDVLNGGLTTYYKQQHDSSETTKSPQLEENETMIYWKGSDPNGDKLIYDLEYRLKGEKNYRKLANNLETPYFRFKSYLMPSGIYDFRITASDRFDNPIDLSKTKTLEVLNIKYDNDSPEIFDFAVKTEGNKRIITFRAEDKLSFLKTVRYSTITEEWHYILPDDKVLDSMSENFTIIIDDEEAGSITIEVLDTEGNIKYYSFVI